MGILNLCDIDLHWNINEIDYLIFNSEMINKCKIETVYLGSYFCARYFEHFAVRYLKNLKTYFRKKNLEIVFVIPIFSQDLLVNAKQLILQLLEDKEIKMIVVNDLGMLSWISNFKIPVGIGRLFTKDSRDFRYTELRNHSIKSDFINGLFQILKEQYKNIVSVEIENIYLDLNLDEDVEIVIHYPYVYQSVGHICFYANSEYKARSGFFANKICNNSCMSTIVYYQKDNEYIIRVGRAIFYKELLKYKDLNSKIKYCYWPLDLWNKK